LINQQNKNKNGFSLVDLFFILLGFLIMGSVGLLVFHSLHHTSKNASTTQTSSSGSSSTSNASYTVLSPATVPSKTAECNQQITFSSNGNSGPVQCSNGDLNVLEWNALATLEPTVLTLGYGATSIQVQTALCNDVKSSQSDANTNNADIIEGTVYQIAKLYYDWNFSPDPSTVLSGGC
jgi:hypothetical protein